MADKEEDLTFQVESIECYKSLQVLWMVKSDGYRNRQKKDAAYVVLLGQLQKNYLSSTFEFGLLLAKAAHLDRLFCPRSAWLQLTESEHSLDEDGLTTTGTGWIVIPGVWAWLSLNLVVVVVVVVLVVVVVVVFVVVLHEVFVEVVVAVN
ncbi:hypothetical protein ElyMa_001760200 [Elysia marginata]|uniref:Uncharacterized protein n=1 Tax=Elysia marginata TaxID=1093978 RepID=A0AAV4EBP3_9GAST|nr:hypothetical protein ElyMa_001760200 [Elysia marginata]